MANNYTQSSSLLEIPADKIGRVQEIVDRVFQEEEENGNQDTHCKFEIREKGVLFADMESFNPEMTEKLVRELVEVLELDGPFYCEWANTCSCPRPDEFSGGAFAVVRGKNTIWLNTGMTIRDMVADGDFPT